MKQTRMKASEVGAQIQNLKGQLNDIRRESLIATRQGDYRRVAKLTTQAACVNKAIMEAEGVMAVV